MNRETILETIGALTAVWGILYGLFFVFGTVFLPSDFTQQLLFVSGIGLLLLLSYVSLRSGYDLFFEILRDG